MPSYALVTRKELRLDFGPVAKLADALDLGSSGETRGSSNLLRPILKVGNEHDLSSE